MSSLALNATHNRAGEIIYDQIGPLTIRATIITYTKASSTAADRDSLTLFWGDGSFENVGRSNGSGAGEIIQGRDLKVNFYEAVHTYPGRASYTLSFTDPNRVSDIVNLNFPNSVDVQFYVQTTFTLLNTQFQGLNNSARLLQPPIDNACIFQRFEHNPNAFDPDGDSLAFELITPFQGVDEEVPNYIFPSQVNPGPNNTISLNPVTGDFVWVAPQLLGEYSIAILVKEYRDGVLINSTVRDMQILVALCENIPPVIESIEEICVVAGEMIEFPIYYDDPDDGQEVELSFTGGPFVLDYFPAEIIGSVNEFVSVPDSAVFRWQTQCEHVNDQFYQIVLKAKDDVIPEIHSLSDLQTVRIKVVAPPPENLEGVFLEDAIDLTWNKPYNCEETIDSFFLGFSVWRRNGSNPFAIDSCQNGLAGKGYQKINFQTRQFENDKYIFRDDQLPETGIVCYRVLAQFAPRTPDGLPFNIVESLASDEVCFRLNGDIPLITNVSVTETDSQNGTVFINWIKPDPTFLDTLENPGPYRYQLLRSSDNGLNYEEISNASFVSTSFGEDVTTQYNDLGLSTSTQPYYYRVDFYSNDQFYKSSSVVSSVFLNIQPSDMQNNLTWMEDVPWQNFEYNVFRQDPGMAIFDSFTTVEPNNYRDLFLMNDEEYCYFIESVGTYGINGIPEPLLNNSQIVCATPEDFLPPCTPNLSVTNQCNEAQDGEIIEDFFNILTWNNPSVSCENSQDVAAYNIYFAANPMQQLTILETITDPTTFTFEHTPDLNISGCYAISSIDSIGNESAISDLICVENCPVYLLPNTFTPNGDGANEFFVPIESRFVEIVNFKLYNRWGNLIYETQDPLLNWDGTNLKGNDVDDGVYYYSCVLSNRDINGITQQSDILSGFIQIIRD